MDAARLPRLARIREQGRTGYPSGARALSPACFRQRTTHAVCWKPRSGATAEIVSARLASRLARQRRVLFREEDPPDRAAT